MANTYGMVTTRASADYTTAALDSFFQQTPLDPEDRFLLIDNDGGWDPGDQSYEKDDRFQLIVQPRPNSFAENANFIIGHADERNADAFILNNDIIFTPDWLIPLANPVPAVMTPTCNQNQQYRRGPLELKPVMTLAEFRAGEKELPHVLAEHRARHSNYIVAYKTNFFCVKIPPAVYRRIGLFDTGFGQAGGEDDDYCIRAYLNGLQVVVALGSYLVHFGGRSTWNGPETLQQSQEREREFIGAFQRKWGPMLARFLLHRDPSVLSSDPSLGAVQQQGGIPALYAEMARRDGIDLSRSLGKTLG